MKWIKRKTIDNDPEPTCVTAARTGDRDRGGRIIKSEEIFCLIIPEEATILCQGVANMSLLIRHVKLIDEGLACWFEKCKQNQNS